MPLFSYSGRSASGELVRGIIESADSGAVAAQLAATGIIPVDIDMAAASASKTGAGPGLFGPRRVRVGTTDLMLFSRQMYALLKAGVPIMGALGGLQESTSDPGFRAALQSVRENLDGGRDLSTSLRRQGGLFNPFYVSMVYVGETTGRLEEIFLRLFHHLEFQDFMRNQVKAALRYPSFVIVAMAAAISVINLFVIPAFAKVYRGFGAELPVVTRWLIGFSDFMVAWWPALLVGVVGAVVGFYGWVRLPAGRLIWDRTRLRLPIAGKIVRKATIARFARSFALATRSGVPITQGLSLSAQTVDNAYMAQQIERMREGVERGESVLRTAIASGVFTPVALQMVMVGEESGSIDDMMEEVADMYQRDLEYELKTLSSQIEPILIIALGILVLILALGVFLPIWDLAGAAFKHK